MVRATGYSKLVLLSGGWERAIMNRLRTTTFGHDLLCYYYHYYVNVFYFIDFNYCVYTPNYMYWIFLVLQVLFHVI